VNSYFLGKARDLPEADSLAVGYAAWMVSTGKLRTGSLFVEYKLHGDTIVTADLDVSDIPPDGAEPVKGAIGGVAHP
jgi:hypothetical protein